MSIDAKCINAKARGSNIIAPESIIWFPLIKMRHGSATSRYRSTNMNLPNPTANSLSLMLIVAVTLPYVLPSLRDTNGHMLSQVECTQTIWVISLS